MNEDRLKWAIIVALIVFFAVLSIWNENHLGEENFLTDPLLIPIPIIIAGVILWYTWWYKMKDGNPREFSITGNFTIANNDPLGYIQAKGPWPKCRVYAKNGIWRPKFVLNLWGGGKKFGYDIAPDYCYENLGIQVINRVARKQKFVTPEQKSRLPPHLINDLLDLLDDKHLAYDHESTPIWFGTRPLKLPPDIEAHKIEDQTEQVQTLCSEIVQLKEINDDWQDRYSALLRSIKAKESGFFGDSGADEKEYKQYGQYGDGNEGRR
jgi:hypothetical protein